MSLASRCIISPPGAICLAVARDGGYFEAETLDEVEKFLNAPAEWSAAHGGASELKG